MSIKGGKMSIVLREKDGVIYNSFCIYKEGWYEVDPYSIRNTNYGNYTKEELFWAIYERILIPNHLYSYDRSILDDRVHLFEITDDDDKD